MSISVGTKSLDEPEGLTQQQQKLQKSNFNEEKCQSNCLGKYKKITTTKKLVIQQLAINIFPNMMDR